jgi:hypothetical protein
MKMRIYIFSVRNKFNVLKGTKKDLCPICGAAEYGTHIILRFTKSPFTNWKCVREMEVPHVRSFE